MGPDCGASAVPNTGETEIPGQLQSSIVVCLSEQGSIPVSHRIVTHDTERARDLYGMLRLSRVSGDPTVADIRYFDAPYALGSPIPVIERGHSGCGEHTWHDGTTTFSVIPRNPGEVTFKAAVDPDPECCEGDGVPTVEAQITVTVMAATTATMTLDPSSISAQTDWLGMPPDSSQSDITVTWDPPECVGTLEIVEIDGTGGYVPPGTGSLEKLSDTQWRYRAFDEPQTEKHPERVAVSVAAMQGTQELTRVQVVVRTVFKWWISGHKHGPGDTMHTPTESDYKSAVAFILWKYSSCFPAGGDFSEVSIADTATVSCRIGVVTWVDAAACTNSDTREVVFGTSTFTQGENIAASIIGHELFHTTGADECEALTWELDQSNCTRIDAEYLHRTLLEKIDVCGQ